MADEEARANEIEELKRQQKIIKEHREVAHAARIAAQDQLREFFYTIESSKRALGMKGVTQADITRYLNNGELDEDKKKYSVALNLIKQWMKARVELGKEQSNHLHTERALDEDIEKRDRKIKELEGQKSGRRRRKSRKSKKKSRRTRRR